MTINTSEIHQAIREILEYKEVNVDDKEVTYRWFTLGEILDQLRQADENLIGQIIDQVEIAQRMGITVNYLRQMRHRAGKATSTPASYQAVSGMPDSIGGINGGPVWRRSEIEEWIEGREQPVHGPALPNDRLYDVWRRSATDAE